MSSRPSSRRPRGRTSNAAGLTFRFNNHNNIIRLIALLALIGLPRYQHYIVAQQPKYQLEPQLTQDNDQIDYENHFDETTEGGGIGIGRGLANSQKILIQDSEDDDGGDYDYNDYDYDSRDAYTSGEGGGATTVPVGDGTLRRVGRTTRSSSSSSSSSSETYLVRKGGHPRISYPNLKDYPNTEIRIRYLYDPNVLMSKSSIATSSSTSSNSNSNSNGGGTTTTTATTSTTTTALIVYDDCPRHFLWLSDQAVEAELIHRLWNSKNNRRRHDHWRERVILEKTYFTLFYGGIDGLASQYMDAVDDFQTDLIGWDVMDRASNHCQWEGVICNNDNIIDNDNDNNDNEYDNSPPPMGVAGNETTTVEAPVTGRITSFAINGFSLEGTLPSDLRHLSALEHIDLNGNRIRGTIPTEWGTLTNLKSLNMAGNHLTGSLPSTFAQLVNMKRLWLGSNRLNGTIPDRVIENWANTVQVLDLSQNNFHGTIPKHLLSKSKQLKLLYLEDNQLSGTLPEYNPSSSLGGSGSGSSSTTTTSKSSPFVTRSATLEVIDVGNNQLTGTIPTSWTRLSKLRDLNLAGNRLSGSLPTHILKLTKLEVLVLSRNQLTGSIPRGAITIHNLPGDVRSRNPSSLGGRWDDMTTLKRLFLNDNQFSGTIPSELFHGLSASLVQLDVGNNRFEGSIPTEIGRMSKLEQIDAQGNRLNGTLPVEMNRMYPDIQLNLTNNFITGTVPKIFCGGGTESSNLLYRQFGCDAVLCPAGTFHPNGAASLFAGCRPCPIKRGDDELFVKILGRTTCEGTEFVHGDLNGDGILSEREILRLLYTYTIGRNWGAQFDSWADTGVHRCDLNGVICVEDSVAKIDLTDAAMCTNGDRRAGPITECKGIPAEISQLPNLEILMMNRRQFLRGTLPSEIGKLKKLKYLDISSCPLLTGTIPTEIGRLTNLRYLNIGGCRFNGTLPEELYQLTNIEKLHLSMNSFTGTLSSSIGKMTKVKELMCSRTYLSGSIPPEIGELTAIENLEMYGNRYRGVIPDTLGNCTNLKRIDLFNNKLSGTIPETLTRIESLQILHIKLNHLTGTISSGFGRLPYLSWFDVSTNRLHGTIPDTFGSSRTLKDFRLGGNMIYDPIPKSLCTNPNINGGLTRTYGCSGVVCPLGTYSDPGHATHSEGCKPCSEGRTTMYLGSSTCTRITEADIITMLYEIMGASSTSALQRSHWEADRGADICGWNGITCDETNETIEAISLPLMGLHEQ